MTFYAASFGVLHLDRVVYLENVERAPNGTRVSTDMPSLEIMAVGSILQNVARIKTFDLLGEVYKIQIELRSR